MIICDIDLGGYHPYPMPRVGQLLGTAIVEGSRTMLWPRGRGMEQQYQMTTWATSFAGAGNQSGGSYLALRYLLRQLEELVQNADHNPMFIQWAATAQSGQYNVATPHDGWYLIDDWEPDYKNFVVGGLVQIGFTAELVAPGSPTSLAVAYAGGSLLSNYSATPTPLIAFPLGSTLQPPTSGTRAGAEGSYPFSISPVPNPAPFVRGTVAQLYDAGVRVLDTINTGTNPVPVAGGVFLDADWVQVYGTQHALFGDYVITNGLLLLLMQPGQANLCSVYFWNTSLGTPTWQLMGTIQHQDNAGNNATLREVNLDVVGPEEVRVRAVMSTSAGHYSMLKLKLKRGRYDCYLEAWPQTQSWTSQANLIWSTNGAYATGFTETTSSTTFPSNLATTAANGYGGGQASASGSPIFGFLYQNIPATAQGRLISTTSFGLGDTVGPVVGNYELYGFWVIPTSGANSLTTDRNLMNPVYQQFLYDQTSRWVRG